MATTSGNQRLRWLSAKPPKQYLAAELMRIIREVSYYSRGFRTRRSVQAQQPDRPEADPTVSCRLWSLGARPHRS